MPTINAYLSLPEYQQFKDLCASKNCSIYTLGCLALKEYIAKEVNRKNESRTPKTERSTEQDVNSPGLIRIGEQVFKNDLVGNGEKDQ